MKWFIIGMHSTNCDEHPDLFQNIIQWEVSTEAKANQALKSIRKMQSFRCYVHWIVKEGDEHE